MSFSADTFRSGTATGGRAVIDHRLERLALINDYRRGRLRRDQLCDAHPELIRAAKNLGTPSSVLCPICEEVNLVLVTYVFGPRLPSHGRCVATKADLAKYNDRSDDLDAYVVEACISCRWHHLLRVLPVGGQRSARPGRKVAATAAGESDSDSDGDAGAGTSETAQP